LHRVHKCSSAESVTTIMFLFNENVYARALRVMAHRKTLAVKFKRINQSQSRIEGKT